MRRGQVSVQPLGGHAIFLGGPNVGKTGIIRKLLGEQCGGDPTQGIDPILSPASWECEKFRIIDTGGKHLTTARGYIAKASTVCIVCRPGNDKSIKRYVTLQKEKAPEAKVIIVVSHLSEIPQEKLEKSDFNEILGEKQFELIHVSLKKYDGVALKEDDGVALLKKQLVANYLADYQKVLDNQKKEAITNVALKISGHIKQYVQWHQNATDGYDRDHKNGFFSWMRHGAAGLERARGFFSCTQDSSDEEKEGLINSIIDYLEGDASRFHVHSLGSYIGDALAESRDLEKKDIYTKEDIYQLVLDLKEATGCKGTTEDSDSVHQSMLDVHSV